VADRVIFDKLVQVLVLRATIIITRRLNREAWTRYRGNTRSTRRP